MPTKLFDGMWMALVDIHTSRAARARVDRVIYSRDWFSQTTHFDGEVMLGVIGGFEDEEKAFDAEMLCLAAANNHLPE